MKLEDMKIIVTGGASGMGRHFAEQLHAAGAQVAVGDVNAEGLETLPEGIHRRRLNVASESECVSFVAWAGEGMGGLNGLINNAGIIRDGLLVKKSRSTGDIVKMSLEQLEAVIDVNLIGATLMAREVAAHMIDRGEKGVVVNVSSIARHGSRGQTNYVASKAAMAMNTVTWMREWARYGIRCGAIAPGMVETAMTQGMNQKAKDALVAGIPVGRIGLPEDLWLAVKFIIECEYFNGRTIDVDGGGGMG
ncbi:MAG: SDR family NAD(P)-dependent oxidoreductase [Myxococcota bacterium]